MEIVIHNLSKNYGNKAALQSVTLTIPTGMYGLLGRNGAGKTTFLRILATLSTATNGEVVINGVSLKETSKIREMIGYLPQDFSMYRNMTVYGAMDYLGVLSNLSDKTRKERIAELLEKVNLKDKAHTKIRALSGGMKQRLGIAQALLHNPNILIVDEPTARLDPEERIRFRNLLSEFSEERIVLLSTHIAADIEAACENVAVLHEGHLIFHGTVEELTQKAEGKVYVISVPKKQDKYIKDTYTILNMNSSHSDNQYRILSETSPKEPYPCRLETPTLEDGYLYLLNHLTGGITS